MREDATSPEQALPREKAGEFCRGIVIASPEGLGGGGGMGSVTRAMKSWMDENRPDMRTDVLDPRGSAAAFWPVYLVVALVRLLVIRVVHRSEILHLQVSRKSSFVRKGALLWLGRALGMRTVVHHHGSEFIQFYRAASPRMQAFVRWVVESADINIVLGERWRAFLVEELGLADERIVIRFNATQDVAAIGPRRSEDPWHFVIMANLMPRKGVGELLEAVRMLSAEGHPVRLTLAGGGEIERYKNEAAALGIADRCSFTGWISGSDVPALFLSRSALVLPSHNEGLPMAIIEALSARLPVIATPVGSIPEVLEDEKTCLFVTPGDASEIAAAMARIAGDPGLTGTLIANGRALYEERFDIGAYMKNMLALYAHLLTTR